jgi:pilus assembly protein Flp/PilA
MIKTMKRFITKLIKDDSGQDLVEYALLLSVVAVVGVAGLSTLASTVSGTFGTVNGKFTAGS